MTEKRILMTQNKVDFLHRRAKDWLNLYFIAKNAAKSCIQAEHKAYLKRMARRHLKRSVTITERIKRSAFEPVSVH